MRIPLLIILLLASIATASAQPADTAEKKWYDTLTVTRPRYARITAMERLALSAFIALSLPVTVIVGGTTLFPPGFLVRREDGVDRFAMAVQSGIGFGGDTMALTWFPAARLQGEFAYFFNDDQPARVRLSLDVDHQFGSIDRRDFIWFGVAGGLGISTDFADEVSPFAEGFIGLSNPLGIRYVPLFPMHNYGLRFRTGYDFGSSHVWYEAALIATSTFSL
jgi:hypothetical protein